MCVSSASFSILVNGVPSTFFRSGRGIRQGFPLSSFLFILSMEGLCRLFNKARSDGLLLGVKVACGLAISLLIFVDDVIILGRGSEAEWSLIKELLNMFCYASSMSISYRKSMFRHNCSNDQMTSLITNLFNIQADHIDNGMNYLGYHLKPNHYIMFN